MSKPSAASTPAAFAQIQSAAMEWTPSDKMTFTDLRAILASWDIPSISNDKSVLIKEVARHYRGIMLARSNRRPVVPSFVLGLPSFPLGRCTQQRRRQEHRNGLPANGAQLYRLRRATDI